MVARMLAMTMAMAVGLVACGSPYVYTKDEFDREFELLRRGAGGSKLCHHLL